MGICRFGTRGAFVGGNWDESISDGTFFKWGSGRSQDERLAIESALADFSLNPERNRRVQEKEKSDLPIVSVDFKRVRFRYTVPDAWKAYHWQ